MNTRGGPQRLSIINESGLYALILTSRKPEARKFKKWVTAEVLPALRKQGCYAMPGVTPEPVVTMTQKDYVDLIEQCVERCVTATLRAKQTVTEPRSRRESGRENFSEWEKAEMVRLDEMGVGAAEIASLLYRPVSSVRNFLWRRRRTGQVYN